MKNIIFDIGNVLIGFRWKDMCLEAGLDEERADKIGRGFFLNPRWPDFDAGFVTTEEMIRDVAERNPELEEDARWFIKNGKKGIVERPKIWELMKKLKETGYRIYVLSNYAEELFKLHMDGLPFWDVVDGGVVSYQINRIKPDPTIYQHLMQKYDLKPEECLFFDDRGENAEMARKLGMQAVTVVDGAEEFLAEELRKLLRKGEKR